jgi:hypothetical protein
VPSAGYVYSILVGPVQRTCTSRKKNSHIKWHIFPLYFYLRPPQQGVGAWAKINSDQKSVDKATSLLHERVHVLKSHKKGVLVVQRTPSGEDRASVLMRTWTNVCIHGQMYMDQCMYTWTNVHGQMYVYMDKCTWTNVCIHGQIYIDKCV